MDLQTFWAVVLSNLCLSSYFHIVDGDDWEVRNDSGEGASPHYETAPAATNAASQNIVSQHLETCEVGVTTGA